jgi:hypothetical protein
MRHGHLIDAPESLIKRMGNDSIDQLIVNGDKTVNRVIDYFMKSRQNETIWE